jgi:hypothetical protein
MLKDVALQISEDTTGSSGDLTRAEIVDRAASALADYVFEALLENGIRPGTVIDQRVYDSIRRLVACGMLAQSEHDDAMWLSVVTAADEVPPHRASGAAK